MARTPSGGFLLVLLTVVAAEFHPPAYPQSRMFHTPNFPPDFAQTQRGFRVPSWRRNHPSSSPNRIPHMAVSLRDLTSSVYHRGKQNLLTPGARSRHPTEGLKLNKRGQTHLHNRMEERGNTNTQQDARYPSHPHPRPPPRHQSIPPTIQNQRLLLPRRFPLPGYPPRIPPDENIPLEVLQLLPDAVKGVYSRYSTTTSTAKPPVIWFPNTTPECETSGGSSSFNTFSFLAMVVSVTNLVSILASNANNNLNNNDDNNNVNNDNIQGGNENNNNNNLDLLTMVTFGGRKRRHLQLLTTNNSLPQHHLTPILDDVTAGTGVLFLRAWYRSTRAVVADDDVQTDEEKVQVKVKSSASNSRDEEWIKLPFWENTGGYSATPKVKSLASLGCIKRSLCEANHRSVALGRLAHDVAEVLSVAFVDFLMPGSSSSSWRSALLRAGGRGRSGWDCEATYQCDPQEWAGLNAYHHHHHPLDAHNLTA
ncbi:uncharacterized protein LOC121868245 isoform X1 [Homarus americanus]|uniref:uncharacterized protein LOC121868245 isoform X1 n=1 Tax=Homarus americanus TaxID=6706 RepID=UPI001C464066|nr:uncharacterized protein LOC121868245 isoform X1 [Homarus americanus]